MKVNVPELQEAADQLAVIRHSGVRINGDVRHHASEIVGALLFVGLGLFAVANAIIYATEGSKVAGKGGRHGR